MSTNVDVTESVRADGVTKTGTETIACGAVVTYDEAVSGTDQLIALTLDVSQAKVVWIKAKDTAMTIEWNDNAGADGSLTLAEDEVVSWKYTAGANVTNPLGTTDITALYVTDTGGAGGTLQMVIGYDPTV